jgi:hypothetical protein
MSRIMLPGLNGSNPLGFLASLGLVRLTLGVRLAFCNDGTFQAFLDGFQGTRDDLVNRVIADATAAAAGAAVWRFSYMKPATKRTPPLPVADLKPPPAKFKRFLTLSLNRWLKGNDEAAAYAAAYATDVAVDINGNTKPTAFHFTAAQQTFLGAVESIRASLTEEWVRTSLFDGHGERPGRNLRWDPNAERNWALMAKNPNKDGTQVNAPLEWLAFRGLPLFPSFPLGSRIVTTCVVGHGEEMTFKWPLWSVPASLSTIRSMLLMDWTRDRKESAGRSVFAVCNSAIRRSSQGFGNFGPSSVL